MFRLFLWPHRFLLLGPGVDADAHQHHAAQICLALRGNLRVRTAAGGPWREGPGFFVPPDTPHDFEAGESPNAFLYLDAESTECEEMQRRLRAVPVPCLLSTTESALTALRSLLAHGGSGAEAEAACREVLGFAASAAGGRSLDPRIAMVLEHVRGKIAEPLRISELAKAAHVSESWLTHHFTATVGLPLRRYVLWQRLAAAIAATLSGQTLTQAAHAAGFSDSAHLSRTFRDTFGVAPSLIFQRRDLLDVKFLGAS